MEKIVETEICKDSSGFNFGQVQFVMVIKYPSEGVKQAFEYRSQVQRHDLDQMYTCEICQTIDGI